MKRVGLILAGFGFGLCTAPVVAIVWPFVSAIMLFDSEED